MVFIWDWVPLNILLCSPNTKQKELYLYTQMKWLNLVHIINYHKSKDYETYKSYTE